MRGDVRQTTKCEVLGRLSLHLQEVQRDPMTCQRVLPKFVEEYLCRDHRVDVGELYEKLGIFIESVQAQAVEKSANTQGEANA